MGQTEVGLSNGGRRPTMRDVAIAAEVSVQTVSNVVNGHHHLMSSETRSRVERASAELDYRVNATAKGLRSAQTRTLGFLVLDQNPSYLADPLTNQIIAGVADVAREEGYGLLIQADRPMNDANRLLTPVHEARVDGALVLLSGPPSLRREQIAKLGRLTADFVVFDEVLDDPAMLSVRTSERETSCQLTEQLLGDGHERIGFIAIGLPWANVEQRVLGYVDAHTASGVDPDMALQLYEADWRVAGGTSMAAKLLRLPQPPTAILCGSDLLAMGAMSAVREAGGRIPTDVAVAGFDDFDFAAYVDPPLTTVRVPAYEQGATGARMLLARLAGERLATSQVVLQNEVIRRSSA